MTELVVTRHQSIFNPLEHPVPIHIIGVGATGSRIGMALIELGMTNITFHDFDIVEPHNLANQAFAHEHIGVHKVDAMAALYCSKTGTKEPPKQMVFSQQPVPNPEIPLEGVVFLLTDTMESRREIYEKCLKGNPNVLHVIETRMAATHGNVFQFNPNHALKAAAWVNTLIDDDDAETSACGASISVGTTASVIANFAVWQMMHYLADQHAMSEVTNVYLKPFIVTTESL
ncbi:MAG: ThiF family adenylyltransferase [Cellvibrionaceae bacterium]